jgi:hypothetical protein
MKIVKTGITRIVFLTKRYAIKVPRWNYGWANFISGMYSNLSEAQCWNATRSEYLCPILFSLGGLVVIMPRVQICETEEEIISIPKEEGIDRKPDNYGYHFNRVVCVDYPYHRIKSLIKHENNN